MDLQELGRGIGWVGGMLYLVDGLVLPRYRSWKHQRVIAKLTKDAPARPTMEGFRAPPPHEVLVVCEQCREEVTLKVFTALHEKGCMGVAQSACRPPVHVAPCGCFDSNLEPKNSVRRSEP